MKKIIILGNGPSIKEIDLNDFKKEIVIGTNNIYLKRKFTNIKNSYFTIYDKRFFNPIEKKLKNFLKKFRGKIYLPNKYKKKVKKIIKKENFFKGTKNRLVNEFTKKFCNQKDLFGTVVIEMAIPLALFLKAKHIVLYGCEFDYKLKKNKLTNKSYFYNIKSKKNFDHNEISSRKWSLHQIKSFKKIQLFLKKNKILIEDKTKNGKLNFLKK